MNVLSKIGDFPDDIDPVWAGDGSHLPEWFVSALKVPRELRSTVPGRTTSAGATGKSRKCL